MSEKRLDLEGIVQLSARALQEAAALRIEDAGHMWRFYRDAEDRLCRRDADGKEEVVPDYPNDITAAMSLEPQDRRREYGKALMAVLGLVHGETIEWETVMDLAFARAIDRTCAFILAVESENA